MAQFELTLLGTPRIRADGQLIRFTTRKTYALLIVLAVEAVPVPRDTLIDLLWTEHDVARGQMSLRTTLAYLRRGLSAEHTLAERAAGPLILAKTGTLAINPEGDCRVDVQVLDRAYDLLRRVKAETVSPHDLRTSLEQAVEVYAGDFLHDFSVGDAPNFDDWVTVQREKCHTRFSAILGQLSQLQLEGGQFAAGIGTATRWVAHDALNEIAHRRLMQLHLAAGNRASALHAYEVCQATLARELNAGPSPETVVLAERLRTQTLPTRVPEDEALPESRRPQVTATALIGRADEHRQLVQTYRLAKDGQPQVVVIQGEPGIGKTRLAQEFLGWAAAHGSMVVRVAAYESMVNLPYQIWVEMIRNQVKQPLGRAAFAALDPAWQHALAQLLPEMVTVDTTVRDDAFPIEASLSQSQLFEAVFRLIQQIAQSAGSSPRVVLMDDVQWVNATSWDMLHYLARRCAEEAVPTMLVMTLRQEAADTFEPTLTALRRHVPVTTVQLNALSQADSAHMVQTLIAQTFKQSRATDESTRQIEHFAQTLFAETAGHPLYLIETFKSLVESEVVKDGNPDIEAELARWQHTLAGWVAPGVKEVIGARLRRVSPQAMTLIQAVAVLGQRHEFEACRQVAHVGEADALEQLDETIRRGLLRESATGAIACTHDKISEVVYAGLSASRRRSLHRHSAEALERLYPEQLNDHAPLIAAHFDAANDSRAQPYYQRAGDAAARVYAYREAAAHYARAIDLAVNEARRLDADGYREALRTSITDLHFKRASMHIQMANVGSALETVRRLGDLAREWHDAALEHDTRVWIAPNLALPGPHMQLDEAEQLAEQILPQARAAQSLHDEVQALRTLMRVAQLRTQFDRAAHYGQMIMDSVDVWPNEPLHGHMLIDLTTIALHRHEFDTAQRYLTEALALWRTLDRPALLVLSLSQACWRALCLGDYESAIAFSQEELGISQRLNNEWVLRQSQSRAGPAYFELGQTDHAIAVMHETIRLGQQEGQHSTDIMTHVELASIYGKLGQVSEGLALAHAAYQAAEATMKAWRPQVIPVLVHLYVRQNALSVAESWLAQGRALIEDKHDWPAARILLDAVAAELALAKGDAVNALALSTVSADACRRQGWRQQLPAMLLLRARAFHALGQPDEALSVLGVASDEAIATRAQWSLEQIQNAQRAFETELRVVPSNAKPVPSVFETQRNDKEHQF